MNGLILSSYLAQSGVGSRRACEHVITAGHIEVNGGVVVALNTFVDPKTDRVSYNGQPLRIQKKRYLLLHKPKGYTCSSKDKHADKLVSDILRPPPKERLFTVGRLDKNSEGLLLLTNDGQFAQLISHPRFNVRKTYLVTVKGNITSSGMHQLENGFMDNGEFLKAINAKIIAPRPNGGTLQIIVAEGRKREIRRMCQRLNYKVQRLIRTTIGPIKLGTFRPGYYREPSPKEVGLLRKVTE